MKSGVKSLRVRNETMIIHHRIGAREFFLCLLSIVLVMSLQPARSTEQGAVEEVILVYGENLPDWREYLVGLLEDNLEVRVLPINTSDCLSVALLFPNVKAAVLMGQNADVVRGVQEQVLTCFNHGTGLVGFHDFTSMEVAPELAHQVFPLFANVSRLGRVKEGAFVQNLVKENAHEISQGLVSEVDFKDPEINLALSTKSNKWSGTIPTSGELTILLKDTVYGAPYAAAYIDEGPSVSFAGGDIDNSPENRLKYYGNLFFDEVFQELLVNSVVWVSERETRSKSQLPETLSELQRVNAWEQEVRDSAEKARSQRATTALVIKAGINLLGICAIVIIYLKLIRGRSD
jgi:hypothetical protein